MNEIRELLQTMADDVQDVRPLERSALRRARTRRLAVAATAVASVVSIVAAGTGLALSARGRDEPLTSPAGSPEATPSPPNSMPGEIVAYSTTEEGGEWWLSAYQNDAGELCVDLQHDTGRIVEDCSTYNSEDVGFKEDEASGSAFGWVQDTTGNLWVTWNDDSHEVDWTEDEDDPAEEEEESFAEEPSEGQDDEPDEGENIDISFEGEELAALYDAPEGFPFPVRFYALVPAPENAQALHIMLRNGDEEVIIVSWPEPDVCVKDGNSDIDWSDGEGKFIEEPCEERRRGE